MPRTLYNDHSPSQTLCPRLPRRRPTRAGLPLGRQVRGCCEAFRYCLALAMVEAGKARLVGQEPGEAGAVCTFETVVGERFSRPGRRWARKWRRG